MKKNIIAVNINKSAKTRDTIKQAAHGYWRPIGRATTSGPLEKAEIVVAVKLNTIEGVFTANGVHQDPSDLRYEWELTDAPSLRGLVGQKIPDAGPYWKPGDLAGWKVFDPTVFTVMMETAKHDVIDLGPHTVLLRPDGNLEIGLAPGYELHITSLGDKASSRDRIAAVVHRLSESMACATYSAIAQMLSINSAQSIARSVVKNATITAEEGARVLPLEYGNEHGEWTIPEIDPKWETQGDDPRERAEILLDLGLASPNDDGSASIPSQVVITDGATLRRYLNV